MAYMSETPGDTKGGWHWIGIAHALALTLGLHKNIDYARLTTQESRLRRRIWWSCYIRDRTLALALNRPWRIRDDEFDTDILTMTDFNIDESEVVDSQDLMDSPSHADEYEEMQMVQLSIGLAQLCAQIGDILRTHFALLPEKDALPPSQPPDKTGLTTTLFFARSHPTQIDRIMACDRKLQSWTKNRPPACIYDPHGSDGLVLNQAFVNLVFFSMVSALHSPLLRPALLDDDFIEYHMFSERRVQNAATEISRMSCDLHRLGLGRHYPGAATLLQVPAVITFLREMGAPGGRQTTEVLSSIQACIEIIEDVRARHTGGEIAMKLVTDLLRRAGIAVQRDEQNNRIIGLWHANGMCTPDSCLQGPGVGKLTSPVPQPCANQATPQDGSTLPLFGLDSLHSWSGVDLLENLFVPFPTLVD